MTVKQFEKNLKTYNKNDDIFINAINLNTACIDYLKNLIKLNLLIPSKKELLMTVNENSLQEFLNGNKLLPQMIYRKIF